MDQIVAGLIKIRCYANVTSDYGKRVEVYDGYHTWSKELVAGGVEFIIPTMPSPERKTFYIRLVNGGTVQYSRAMDLAYGDSVTITLNTAYDPATKSDITSVRSDLTSLETRLIGRITYGTQDKSDGSSYLQEGYIYCYI